MDFSKGKEVMKCPIPAKGREPALRFVVATVVALLLGLLAVPEPAASVLRHALRALLSGV